MAISKRTLIAGAAVAAISLAGVGSVGLASAATSDSTNGTSIVDRLATKFNLSKTDVQAVFDEDRSAHEADMQQHMEERLTQAVTDGKLTQDQADHIKQVAAEIKTLVGNKRPDEMDDATRQQVKDKLDALRTWAQQNNVDMQYLMVGGPGMGHGMGGPGRGDQPGGWNSDGGSSSDSSAANSN
jgi:hypothetical protein